MNCKQNNAMSPSRPPSPPLLNRIVEPFLGTFALLENEKNHCKMLQREVEIN